MTYEELERAMRDRFHLARLAVERGVRNQRSYVTWRNDDGRPVFFGVAQGVRGGGVGESRDDVLAQIFAAIDGWVDDGPDDAGDDFSLKTATPDDANPPEWPHFGTGPEQEADAAAEDLARDGRMIRLPGLGAEGDV